MGRYFVRRLLTAVPLLFGISLACFALLHAVPGGPFTEPDPRLGRADLERIQAVLELDAPVHVRYVRWLGRVVRGDLGRSLVTGEPVRQMILARLPATLELMGAALVLAVGLGVGLGVATALRRDGPLDHLVRVLSLVGVSVPVFWLGMLAIVLFSVRLGWLPPGDRATLGAPASLLDRLHHLVLPAAVLATVQLPLWCRHMRASLLETLQEGWLRSARARGLPEWRIVLRHGVRPALAPVVTLLGLQIPTLFTGAVITERIFAWPGIGRLFYEGVERFDYTRIMGIVLVAAGLVVLGNLAADLANARLDPRLRPEEGS